MKNIHFLGFILWLIASFFCFNLFTFLYHWLDTGGIVFKIIVVFITAIILLIGFYKILLSFLLLVHKSHENFNLISTVYYVLGLIGLTGSYLYFWFDNTIVKKEIFSQSLSFTFGFFLAIILVNGFVLFPKSLRKFKN